MTLTKKDEEKIRKIVREEFKVKNKEQHPNYDEWDEEAIESDLLDIKIAPENYWEIDEDGNKKEYFTWDEAMDIEKKLPDGWRLPTRSEWAILAEEFGTDDNGELDGAKLSEALDLPLSGYRYGGSTYSQGSYGYYWSSVAYNNNYAYNLLLNSSDVYPQDYYSKWNGFTVRCIAAS